MKVEVIYTIEVPEDGEGTRNFLADTDMDIGHGGQDYTVVGRRFGAIRNSVRPITVYCAACAAGLRVGHVKGCAGR